MVQQATVFGASFTAYVVASETGSLNTVCAKVAANMKSLCVVSLRRVADKVVGWAHSELREIPSFVAWEDKERVRSRWEFWRTTNDYVKSSGPFRPLKLFKHAVRLL